MSSQTMGRGGRITFSVVFLESPQHEEILPVSHRPSSKKPLKMVTFAPNPTGYLTKSEPKARSSWFSCVSNCFHKKN